MPRHEFFTSDNPNLPPSAFLAANSQPGWVYSPARQPPGPYKPKYFHAKKRALMLTTVLFIIALFITILCIDRIIENIIEANGKAKAPAPEIVSLSKFIVQCFMVVILFLQMLFFYGIAKESLCLSISFAVFTITTAVYLAMRATKDPALWLDVGALAVISTLAMLYVLDLSMMRDSRRSGEIEEL